MTTAMVLQTQLLMTQKLITRTFSIVRTIIVRMRFMFVVFASSVRIILGNNDSKIQRLASPNQDKIRI